MSSAGRDTSDGADFLRLVLVSVGLLSHSSHRLHLTAMVFGPH